MLPTLPRLRPPSRSMLHAEDTFTFLSSTEQPTPLIPWRRIAFWECVNCGMCCGRYRVILTRSEYERLVEHFGPRVAVDRKRPRMVKLGSRCFFQRFPDGRSQCLLQHTGLKPVVCRIFPFMTSPAPLRQGTARDSHFVYGEREVYVYGNSGCPAMTLGSPSEVFVSKVLPEVTEISLFGRRLQRYSTSSRMITRMRSQAAEVDTGALV